MLRGVKTVSKNLSILTFGPEIQILKLIFSTLHPFRPIFQSGEEYRQQVDCFGVLSYAG